MCRSTSAVVKERSPCTSMFSTRPAKSHTLSSNYSQIEDGPAKQRRASTASDAIAGSQLFSSTLERATRHWFDETAKHWKSERVAVAIEVAPFARGSFKVCHLMRLRDKGGNETSMVAKFLTRAKEPEQYFKAAQTQQLAREFAKQFNQTGNCTRRVSFVPVHVLELHERAGALACMEPLLNGCYVKHLNNAGELRSQDALAQAFCHFTWEASGQRVLITDIQGVGDIYTDPSIQCSDLDAPDFLADGSHWGGKAVETFFKQHRCSLQCRAHALAPAQEELAALCPGMPQPCEAIEPSSGKRRVWARKKAFLLALQRAPALSRQIECARDLFPVHTQGLHRLRSCPG